MRKLADVFSELPQGLRGDVMLLSCTCLAGREQTRQAYSPRCSESVLMPQSGEGSSSQLHVALSDDVSAAQLSKSGG
jgi:hypothetical protein